MHSEVHQISFKDCGNLQVCVVWKAMDRAFLSYNPYVKAQSAHWVITKKEALGVRSPSSKGNLKQTIKLNRC